MGNSSSSISLLRQRMIDDMTMRRLGSKSQISYLRHVIELNKFPGHSPHKATAEDLRRRGFLHWAFDNICHWHHR